jgi:hypothetical protein
VDQQQQETRDRKAAKRTKYSMMICLVVGNFVLIVRIDLSD